MQTGYVPQGLVMGTCVYHIAHRGARPDARLGRAERRAAQLHPGPLRGPRAGHDPDAGRGRPRSAPRDRRGAARGEVPPVGQPHHRVPLPGHRRGQDVRRRSRCPRPPRSSRSTTDAGRPGPTFPEAAERRLSDRASHLRPDRARLRRLPRRWASSRSGFVQGFCVMQWSWYGVGSPYWQASRRLRHAAPAAAYVENYRCPHGFVSAEHRAWGQNFEQTWVEQAWAEGFASAYSPHGRGGHRRSAPTAWSA